MHHHVWCGVLLLFGLSRDEPNTVLVFVTQKFDYGLYIKVVASILPIAPFVSLYLFSPLSNAIRFSHHDECIHRMLLARLFSYHHAHFDSRDVFLFFFFLLCSIFGKFRIQFMLHFHILLIEFLNSAQRMKYHVAELLPQRIFTCRCRCSCLEFHFAINQYLHL